MFQASERALHDGGLGIGGDAGGQAGAGVQPAIQTAQQCAAAAEHHATIDEIGDQVGAALIERGADAIDDSLQRIGQGLAHFAAADFDAPRQAGGDVDAADVGQK